MALEMALTSVVPATAQQEYGDFSLARTRLADFTVH